jgi:hypothetical protein
MVALLLALLAASGAMPNAQEDLPGGVSESLTRALVVPSARIVPLRANLPRGCRALSTSVPRPIDGSARVAVRIVGRGCSGWGWIDLQVWADTSVTTRVVRAGEMLASASTIVEREIRPGQMPLIVAGDAIAARTLPTGAMIRVEDVSRAAGGLGEPVKVVFVSGVVAIEAQGRRSNCLRGRDCAVLSSGKHVEGHLDSSGRLVVEVPR